MSAPYVLPEAPKRQTLRVAHYGTGATGGIALRMLIERPDLELVAHLVHTDAKAGRDSGEIIGRAPVGVRATKNLDDILESDADCVLYCAGAVERSADETVAEMSRILAAGKNIVSIALFQAVNPRALPDALYDQLSSACEQGASSFFVTGIGPGFNNDVLTILATSISDRVERVDVCERVLDRTYPFTEMMFAAMGFGSTPDEYESRRRDEFVAAAYSGGISMIATALGVQLDEMRVHQDVAVTPTEIVAAGGVVPAGRIASVRKRVEGVAAGKVVVSHSRISAVSDDPIDDWEPHIPAGSDSRRATRIVVHAYPEIQCELRLTGGDAPGEEATAARAVNAIRPVCEASSGVKSPLDLPLFGGPHF